MKTKVLKDKRKGRGLYAVQEIKKGEIIEVCELLLMDEDELPPSLEGYAYQYNQKKVAIALGNGSLLNHSDRPNAEYSFNYRNKLLTISASKNIAPNEEITINYGYDKDLKKKFKIV